MPQRLLREPHVLAHELRTPLAILAGWYSLVRDGDVSPERDREQWAKGMATCEEAIARLNLIISQACDEASRLHWSSSAGDTFRLEQLKEQTTHAIAESRRVLQRVNKGRAGRELSTR